MFQEGKIVLFFLLFVQVAASSLFGLAALSVVFSADAAEGARSAILHFHETLVRISLVVVATNGIIFTRTNSATSTKDKLEILQTVRHWGHINMFPEKKGF